MRRSPPQRPLWARVGIDTQMAIALTWAVCRAISQVTSLDEDEKFQGVHLGQVLLIHSTILNGSSRHPRMRPTPKEENIASVKRLASNLCWARAHSCWSVGAPVAVPWGQCLGGRPFRRMSCKDAETAWCSHTCSLSLGHAHRLHTCPHTPAHTCTHTHTHPSHTCSLIPCLPLLPVSSLCYLGDPSQPGLVPAALCRKPRGNTKVTEERRLFSCQSLCGGPPSRPSDGAKSQRVALEARAGLTGEHCSFAQNCPPGSSPTGGSRSRGETCFWLLCSWHQLL